MRRRTFDIAAVALLVPLWLVCFALSLTAAFRHTGYPPVLVSRGLETGEYPTLDEFSSSSNAAEAGLRRGDRLIRLGEADLRGLGPVGFIFRTAEQARRGRRLPLVFEREGGRGEVLLEVGSYAAFWPRYPAAVVFLLTALILLFRARPSPLTRVLSYTYLCAALVFTCTFAGSWPVTIFSVVVHVVFVTLGPPLAMRAAVLFPHGDSPTTAWGRFGPLVFAAIGPLDASRVYAFPFPREVGLAGLLALIVAFFIATLLVMTRTYRRSDPIGRRQLKWILLGLYCAVAPPIAAATMAAFQPSFANVFVVSAASLVLIPISVLISVLRYNLFDIDRLITSTASYTVLGVLLLGLLMAAVPQLAQAASEATGVDPGAAQVALALLFAAILVPWHRILRPRIDRFFFADRYRLEQSMEALMTDSSACRDPEELIQHLGRRLHDLLRPETCTIYARRGDAFLPVFVHGRAIPPVFPAEGLLVAALGQRTMPFSGEGLLDRRRGLELGPFDRAALETLGVPVVAPIHRGGDLFAFLCLGPKRSGDIYTSTELAMLSAIAEKVSGQLLSFDQAETIRKAREMQESLRRYVPGALAERLASGRELEVGERELSILFVDIRGYASFAEGREASVIFSTVNRFTEKVSEVVRASGGSVVEFNGDGMMAVFGAPETLPAKELAATRAGIGIVTGVQELALDSAQVATEPLSVGVGIATGRAFVGNVKAVDRMIWTAIGSTTNLAARLQSMTRELGAAIVVDEETWRRAGSLADRFERQPQVRIRGLTEREDLYLLRLGETINSH